jgi:hypothetical protein
VLSERPRAPERAVQIHIDHIEPVLVGDVLRAGHAARDARIVHQDVDAAVRSSQDIRDFRHARGVGHVHLDALDRMAAFLQARARRIDGFGVQVGDGNAGAGLCQRLDRRIADAAGPAGDQRYPAGEPEFVEIGH